MSTLLALALLAALGNARLQDSKPAQAQAVGVRPYNINSCVSEVRLTDVEGKERVLFADGDAKPVVLVFWSYRDPISRYYLKQLTEMQAKYADKLTVYLVDSNHDELVINGDAVAKLREVVKNESISLPLLLDKENRVADDYRAVNNAQAFLIDANHILRYKGGIDDDPRGERRKQGIAVLYHLEKAIDISLKGEKPDNDWTMAAGRPIRRTPAASGKK
jgi:peroxiredoxin